MQSDGATPGVMRAGAGEAAGGGSEWGRRQRPRGTVGGSGTAPGGGGAAPRAEGKGRRGRLFGHATIAIAHLQAAVETFADFNARFAHPPAPHGPGGAGGVREAGIEV